MKHRRLFCLAGFLLALALCLAFAVSLADDAGEDPENALPIEVNQDYRDNTADYDDKDCFRFTLPTKGVVSVTFTNGAEGRGQLISYELRLLDPNGNEIFYSEFKDGESRAQGTVMVGLPKDTYYIRINAHKDNYIAYRDTLRTAEYTFRVNFYENEYWETEDNGGPGSADSIPLGTGYSGTMTGTGDHDWYQFELKEPGYVNAVISHTQREGDDGGWIVTVFDTAGREYTSASAFAKDPSDQEAETQPIGFPAGTYYVRVKTYGYQGGLEYFTYHTPAVYTLKVKHTATRVWEQEFNDEGHPTPIQADTTYYGSVCKGDDQDWYRFKAPATGIYQFTFRHDSAQKYLNKHGWDVIIREGDTELAKYCYLEDEANPVVNELALVKGEEYLIRVSGCTDEGRSWTIVYEFSLSAPVNISKCTVKAIKDRTYTGKAIEPALTLKYKGKKLTENEDYLVTYKKNKAVGTATVKIEGIGRYTGTRKITFSIVPKKVALSRLNPGKKMLTAQWKKASGIDGFEIEYSLKSTFKDAKTVTVDSPKAVSAEIVNLKSGKTYYVRIRAWKKAGGKKYYSAWSAVLKKKVK